MQYVNSAQWDYLWSTNTPAALLAQLREVSVKPYTQAAVILDARVTQCLIGCGDEAALDYAEAALTRYQGRAGLDVALLRAMHLLANMDQFNIDTILQVAPVIQGTDPHRMEAAVFTYFSVGGAASVAGDVEAALLWTARAEGIAQLLGLTHRLRVLRLELARLRLFADSPVDPELVMMDADTPHVGTARWGGQLATQALLARGEYAWAVRYGEARNVPELPLLYALAGMPEPAGQPVGDRWARMAADAVRAAEAGRFDCMPVLPVGETPAQKLGPVLNALRAACGYSSLPNIEMALGARPGRRDLRVMWNVVRLKVALDGELNVNPAALVEEILGDLRTLPGAGEIVGLLARLLPHQMLLLTYAPGAADVPALASVNVPLLTGDTVRGPVRLDVHGPTADVLIGRALGVQIVINTGFVSKMRTKCREVGLDMDRMVTVGHLYRWMGTLSRAAAGSSSERAWGAALSGVVSGAPRLRRLLAGQ